MAGLQTAPPKGLLKIVAGGGRQDACAPWVSHFLELKMSGDTVTITNRYSGEVIASAQKKKGVSLFEGAWYFAPDKVDMTHLIVTERTYTCPYKGVCYWIDLETPEYQAEDVAFVYFETNPGYEFVKDKIGFYAGTRGATAEVE